MASGAIGAISASVFAGQIHFFKLKVNLATWTMVLILDFVGLALLLAAGNKEPFIQIGWCLAAILIFFAALKNRGDWKWSRTESWSVGACALAVAIWIATGSVWSLLGYLLAAFISVIPQVAQYWTEKREERIKATWLWVVSAFAILLAIIGSPKTPEYMIVLLGLLVLNAGMTWLTLRKE